MIESLKGEILEIGGGANPLFRPNMDIRKIDGFVDIVWDVNAKFDIPSDRYDGVFSRFSIEHMSWRKIEQFIGEVFRIIKPGGKVVVITANLLEQCRVVAERGKVEKGDSCMIFGDQNYEGQDWVANSHFVGFCPDSITELFKAAGFENIIVMPLPECKTDMIMSATKPILKQVNSDDPKYWDIEKRKEAYNADYFTGGGKFGGYAFEGYRDFPVHWTTYNKIMEFKPESVLELGCARGYVLKRIRDAGIPAAGLEVSEHCMGTRAIDGITNFDFTQTPWPFADKQFDLCYSMAVMEHIPEQKIPAIVAEINRVCKRSVHGISFDADDFDKTHTTMKPLEWWRSQFSVGQHTIMDKEDLEKGDILIPDGPGIKLNLGSFTVMFHYGWTNIDVLPLQQFATANYYNFAQMDVSGNLQYADNSVDAIFSSHMIEHLSYDEGLNLLKECYRVLKPGAPIRILVPDLKRLTDHYLDGILAGQGLGIHNPVNKPASETKSQCKKLYELLCNHHKSIYDFEGLRDSMMDAGFTNIYRGEFSKSNFEFIQRETMDMFPNISLIIEAVK